MIGATTPVNSWQEACPDIIIVYSRLSCFTATSMGFSEGLQPGMLPGPIVARYTYINNEISMALCNYHMPNLLKPHPRFYWNRESWISLASPKAPSPSSLTWVKFFLSTCKCLRCSWIGAKIGLIGESIFCNVVYITSRQHGPGYYFMLLY